MKFCILSVLMAIGLTGITSNSFGQAAKSQVPKVDEVFVPTAHFTPGTIKKGDHIDVAATFATETGSFRSRIILDDVEVLNVSSRSKEDPTKSEKDGAYLVVQLTQPESIILKYFKERAKFFDVVRRKAGDHRTISPDGGYFVRSEIQAEQKILNKWLGTWRTSYKQTKTDLVQEEKSGIDKVKCTQIITDEFVQENVEHSDKTKDSIIFTYDRQKKCYRRWEIAAGGKTTESTGKWDADKRTMTWISMGEPSSITTTTQRFVDDDNVEWDVVTKDSTGKVVFHMEGKSVRVQGAR